MSEESPIVREVRERALKISERFGHDLSRYCIYLREREKRHPRNVVNQVTVVRRPEPDGIAVPTGKD
jgi:hypothetical protein